MGLDEVVAHASDLVYRQLRTCVRVQHRRHRGRDLSGDSARVMRNLQKLWGFTVWLETVEEDGALVETTEFSG